MLTMDTKLHLDPGDGGGLGQDQGGRGVSRHPPGHMLDGRQLFGEGVYGIWHMA